MNTLRLIKRAILAGVVALSIGLAIAPAAHASVSSGPNTVQSGPSFDGNESHGKG